MGITSVADASYAVNGSSELNENGGTYVAYIFAHNSGDGEFGPDGDQDIIKCGSFSVNGSYEADVDIGFEPQWVLIKPAQDSGSWLLFDTMRGAAVNGDAAWLAPDLSQQEVNTANRFWPTATGFHIGNYGIPAGNDIIYMAIRRGPLAQPESGTEVFDTVTGSGVQSTGFPVDFLIGLNNRTNTESYDPFVKTRLLGGASYLTTSSTAAEASGSDVGFDTMDGLTYSWPNSNAVAWNWKRAPGFFDVVAYSAESGDLTVPHNLGVTPEMIWIKGRNSGTNWTVWHSGLSTGTASTNHVIYLNKTDAESGPNANIVSYSDTNFVVGSSRTATNNTLVSGTYIAYLFASLDGISKVGSYTGDGTTGQTIDCGFASGARFILIKRTDTSSNWFVWDTERGIVSGNDPYLRLNRDLAEETTQDDVDPQSSGFIVNQGENNLNQSGGSYIFYAIA
jgi:hypothetical protein